MARSGLPVFVGLLAMVGGVGSFLWTARTEAERTRVRDIARGREGRILAAIDALETELIRRFHDRADVRFGYGRMADVGRYHVGPTATFELGPDRATGARIRERNDARETLAEDGRWHQFESYRDLFAPERDEDRAAIATLAREGEDLVFYTVGRTQVNGAARLHGPAHLRFLGPDAPEAEKPSFRKIADRVLTGLPPGSADGWSFTAIPMIADQGDCVGCHNAFGSKADLVWDSEGGLREGGEAHPESYDWIRDRRLATPIAEGDTAGWVVIGRRTTTPWTPLPPSDPPNREES